jgi:hypothetical protein
VDGRLEGHAPYSKFDSANSSNSSPHFGLADSHPSFDSDNLSNPTTPSTKSYTLSALPIHTPDSTLPTNPTLPTHPTKATVSTQPTQPTYNSHSTLSTLPTQPTHRLYSTLPTHTTICLQGTIWLTLHVAASGFRLLPQTSYMGCSKSLR